MKISDFAKYLTALAAGAGVLAACNSNGASTAGGASTGIPSVSHVGRTLMVNGLLITAAHPNLSGHPGSPFSPDRKIRRPNQFISDFGASQVFGFDYPKSDSSIKTISGVVNAQGECTNVIYGVGTKTFWVTASGFEEIEEFDVGGSNPIKTLTTTAGEPVGCAIDPATGNLAATIIENGEVVIYAEASGSGTVTQSPLSQAYFATYDKSSNLYVDGFNDKNKFGLVELKKGSSTWETLSINNSVEVPGNVQYDGTFITVNDQEAHAIYGYTCGGTSCFLKQKVSLSGSSDCDQTWIAKGYVICPDAGNVDGEIYKYPAGGSPIATLTANFSEPLASSAAEK